MNGIPAGSVALALLCWATLGTAAPQFDLNITARDAPDRAAVARETAILSLELRDGATGYPLSGLHPGVWIRPARAGRNNCPTAISRYLAAGANAIRDLDLNGYRFVLLGSDAALSVIDPRLDLASSNLLWIRRFGTAPADWAFDHRLARVFLALPEAVAAHDLLSGAALWRTEVEAVHRLFQGSDGESVWAVARQWVLGLEPTQGTVLRRIALEAAPRDVVVDPAVRRMWILEPGRVVAVELGDDGASPVHRKVPETAARIAYSAAGEALAVALQDEPTLVMWFLDAPERSFTLTLAAPADRMAVSRDGRWLFALDRDSGTLSIVDWARLRLQHVLVFTGRPDQMAVSEDYLYLRETGAARISLVHISTLDEVREPGVLDVALGSRAPKGAVRDAALPAVAPLPEGGGALIAATGDRTVFLYLETGMQAPSNAFRVWTEGPLAVAVHDGALKESRPGRYEAPLRLPHAGRYELLLHLAQPPLAACREFTVGGVGPAVETIQELPMAELRTRGAVRAGQPASIELRLIDRGGDALAELDDVELLLMDTTRHAHWRGAGQFDNGIYRFHPVLPAPGRYRAFVRSARGGFGFEDLQLPELQVQGGGS